MKNKVNILTKLDELESYGGSVPIRYSIDVDDNFRGFNLYLNDVLVYTSNTLTGIVNLTITQNFNKLSGYSFNKSNLKLPQTNFEILFTSQTEPLQVPVEISRLIKYNLPDFIQAEYPKFIDFIQAYYEFLEQSNNPNIIHYNLENYRDIDNVPDYILDYFRKELIPGFNLNLTKDRQTGGTLNERNLIKNIKQFYDSKGTENSIKFLFRILFDKEATIFYPKTKLLRPSDGVWVEDNIITVSCLIPKNMYLNVGAKIYQRSVDGEIESHAIIKKIIINKIAGGYYAKLFLHEISGLFSGETEVIISRFVDGVETEFIMNVIKDDSDNILVANPGYFNNIVSSLSSKDRYLPDNLYWQNDSYDVQGDADPVKFISVAKKLAHPTGLKIFTSFHASPVIQSNFNIQQQSESKSQLIIGNYLAYTPSMVQDLTAIAKTGGGTYKAWPSGIYFGSKGDGIRKNTLLLSVKNTLTSRIVTLISRTSVLTPTAELTELTAINDEMIGALTANKKPQTTLTSFGQFATGDAAKTYWEVAKHPRNVINTLSETTTDGPTYPSTTAFGDILIKDIINIKVNKIV